MLGSSVVSESAVKSSVVGGSGEYIGGHYRRRSSRYNRRGMSFLYRRRRSVLGKRRRGTLRSGRRNAVVAIGGASERGRPRMYGSKHGVRVVHSEYIADIVGTNTNFSVNPFINGQSVNPGLSSCFVWLNSLANSFESYKFNSLRFEYKPRCSTALAGTVLMAIDFDNHDSPPGSKAAIMSYDNAVSSSAWSPCTFVAPKVDLNKRKSYFTRNGAIPSGADSNLYDVGTLYVATAGATGTAAAWGELYVHYDVTLTTPQNVDPITSGVGLLYNPATANTATSLNPFGSSSPSTAMLSVNAPAFNGFYSGGQITVVNNFICFSQYFEGFLVISMKAGSASTWGGTYSSSNGLTVGTTGTGLPLVSGSTQSTAQICTFLGGSTGDSSAVAKFAKYVYYVQANAGSGLVMSGTGFGGSTINLAQTAQGCQILFCPGSINNYNSMVAALLGAGGSTLI